MVVSGNKMNPRTLGSNPTGPTTNLALTDVLHANADVGVGADAGVDPDGDDDERKRALALARRLWQAVSGLIFQQRQH